MMIRRLPATLLAAILVTQAANGRIDYEPMRGGAAECRAVAAERVASGAAQAARCNVEGMMGDEESGGVLGWQFERGAK